jgi:hypothetical protein
MNAAPNIYIGPAFVGWRSWRILPYDALGQAPSIRLCACGTQGIPKVWEPRKAIRAVCGTYEQAHEAPWENCHCGIHAYASEENARTHLATFVDCTNRKKDGVLGWAFGRASLWGRIVEHEHGWRAEHAYPYDITVYGTAQLAAMVQRLYLVDVDTAPLADLKQACANDDDAEAAEELEQVMSDTEALLIRAKRLRAARFRKLERLSDLNWDDFGRWHGLDHLIRPALIKAQGKTHLPVTAREVVVNMMGEAGVPDYEPTPMEIGEIAHDLYVLAMRHEIHRWVRDGSKVRYWSMGREAFDPAFVTSDPTLEYLERDVALISALCICTAGEGEAATSKEMMTVLSAKLGPQASQQWSQSFVRCQFRGWATSRVKREYTPTARGVSVARLGYEPPELPYPSDLNDVLLDALRAAVAEKGDAVSVDDLAWRFRERWHNGHASGHSLGGALSRLANRGQVVKERRPDSKLVYWSPVEA